MMKASPIEMPIRNDNLLKFPDSQLDEEEKKRLTGPTISNEPAEKEKFTPPPWLFQHQALNDALESARVVDDGFLKNKLNHAHFMDKHLLVLLRHPKYEDNVIVRVTSGPCIGSELDCCFLPDSPSDINWKNYTFLHLIVDDGQSVILIPAHLNRMDRRGFSLNLPREGYAVGQRRTRRYACEKIDVELVLRGRVIKGILLDYSPEGLCVRLNQIPFGDFEGSFRSGALSMVQLRRDQRHLFSGLCECIRQQQDSYHVDVVLVPAENQVQGFENEKLERHASSISLIPAIIFDHPFFGKRIQLDVANISTFGFSVLEKKDEGVLMPGMIIPVLTIEFAGTILMQCSAQVVGRFEKDETTVRCDLAILDMDINCYTRLAHLLANSINSCYHISNKVEMDALWEFFFDTGFIYPKKYDLIRSQKEKFKKTYQDLYNNSPEIARHFVYQKNGRLYAHISMVRAYERAWMIQHHAARSVEGRRAGFAVLKQIVMYLANMHRLPSTHMDHMMVYFRPENKFPDRVFGGFARSKENTGVCSMDLFGYLPHSGLSGPIELLPGWSVGECSTMDLWELNLFYRNFSGGLFMDALGLAHKGRSEESFEETYRRPGFLRKWKTYSLKYGEKLEAVLIVNRSDFGFNLSELLNGIKVLLVDPEHLSWPILSKVIGNLLGKYRMEEVSLMFFPADHAKAMNIPYQKEYQLWIYDARFVDRFVQYMRRKFRIKEW